MESLVSHEERHRSTEEEVDRFLDVVARSRFWQSINLRITAGDIRIALGPPMALGAAGVRRVEGDFLHVAPMRDAGNADRSAERNKSNVASS